MFRDSLQTESNIRTRCGHPSLNPSAWNRRGALTPLRDARIKAGLRKQLDKRSSYQEYGSTSVRWSSTVANRESSPVGHESISDRKRLVQILVSVLMIPVGGCQPCCSYSETCCDVLITSSLQNY